MTPKSIMAAKTNNFQSHKINASNRNMSSLPDLRLPRALPLLMIVFGSELTKKVENIDIL
jgi:hypothetical protein